jgi:hypothetical protein
VEGGAEAGEGDAGDLILDIVLTALLLKQDLIDVEFIKAENKRNFTKLDAVQDAALLRSSFQVPTEEAGLRVPHKARCVQSTDQPW